MNKRELQKLDFESFQSMVIDSPELVYRRFLGGSTLLHNIVVSGRVEFVSWLLRRFDGLEFARDSRGNSPFHLIGETLWLEDGRDGTIALELAEVFLDEKVDLTLRNEKQEDVFLALSPRARGYGKWLPLIGLLLTEGCDSNSRDFEGNTYLHHLAMEADCFNSGSIIEILLQYGADPDLRNKSGQTPIDIAKGITQPESEDIRKQFIEHLKRNLGGH